MAVCLDTSVLVEILAGHEEAVAFLAGLEEPVAVSAISIYELLAVEKRAFRIARVEAFAREFAVIPAGYEVCALAASIQASLLSRGEPIPHFDAIIGATAALAGMPLFTFDEHFQRIPAEFGLVLRGSRGES